MYNFTEFTIRGVQLSCLPDCIFTVCDAERRDREIKIRRDVGTERLRDGGAWGRRDGGTGRDGSTERLRDVVTEGRRDGGIWGCGDGGTERHRDERKEVRTRGWRVVGT